MSNAFIIPKIQMPRRVVPPHIPRPHIFARGPRELQKALISPERLDYPGEVPASVQATKPEWYVYWALQRLGKIAGVDFTFQSSLQGGRLMLGGIVADFIVNNPPGLILQVQGSHWHYGMGADRLARGKLQRVQLEAKGYRVVYMDEDDILRNPIYYTTEALAGRDHSKMQEL